MTIGNANAPGNAELHQPLAELLQRSLSTTSTPGVTVALWLDGQVFFSSAAGFRDLEQTTVMDLPARFYIYSVTKSLIATVILRLVEQGRLALDTPVQTYLPQVPIDLPVNIRQILNHSAGLPDYGALPAYFQALKANPAQSWIADEFLNATLSKGLAFVPGQGWGYSNIGFLLLRKVIEIILQCSLRAALRDQIFARLGLRNTFVAQTLEDARQLTPGYSAFFAPDGMYQDIRDLYHPGWVSHGVVISTSADLARIIEAIFTGQLLSPASRATMLEVVDVPGRHAYFQQPAYGLGLMVDRGSRHGLIAGHAGGGPGYSVGALHLPDVYGHRLTSIALANCDQDDLGMQLAFEMAMLVGDWLAS
jgi:D-alanyl-D-alanine carboxypeptidase